MPQKISQTGKFGNIVQQLPKKKRTFLSLKRKLQKAKAPRLSSWGATSGFAALEADRQAALNLRESFKAVRFSKRTPFTNYGKTLFVHEVFL